MAHKHPKSLVRIAPELNQALGIIAKANRLQQYQVAEIALRDWIREHAKGVYIQIQHDLEMRNIGELPTKIHTAEKL